MMKSGFILIGMLALGGLVSMPVLALEPGSAEDRLEQEADSVAEGRPSPMQRKGGGAQLQMQKGVQGRTATSASDGVNTGAGARAINRDECNPLCGMQGIGDASSQPAQQLNSQQMGNQAR